MDDKEKKTIDDSSKIVVISQIPEENPYGITKKYDRKLYDDQTAHKKFHDSQFGDKQTITTEDGQILHRRAKAAKAKYGEARASYHSAQADHIDPIKNAHSRIKDSPLGVMTTDEDFKEVINRQDNFQEKSAHDNASKQAQSGGIQAEIKTDLRILQKSSQNIGKEFSQGAKDALAASAIPLVIRGSQDLLRVAKGEMSLQEAADDIGKSGISIAASGGTVRVATFALSSALKDNTNPLIQKISNVNQIGTVLVISSIIVRATGKYLDGEVDASGFFKEITDSGLSLASGMLASKAAVALFGSGVVAAPVLAAMIASAACSEICAYAKKMEEEKKANEEIRSIAADATIAIQQQQEELNRLLEEDHRQWAQQMTAIFKVIADGLINSDLDKTNDGLQQLLTVYNCNVELYGKEDSLTEDLLNARDNNEEFHII